MAHVGVLDMDSRKPSLDQAQEVDLGRAPPQTAAGHPHQFREVDVAFEPAETAGAQRQRRRWWLWLLVLCLIAAGGYVLLPQVGPEWQPEAWRPHISQARAAVYGLLPGGSQETPKAAAPAAPPASRGVPVVAAEARQGNLDLYL